MVRGSQFLLEDDQSTPGQWFSLTVLSLAMIQDCLNQEILCLINWAGLRFWFSILLYSLPESLSLNVTSTPIKKDIRSLVEHANKFPACSQGSSRHSAL